MRRAAGTLHKVADSLDLDALEAAGIANARERVPLIAYLAGLGFTADEMVEAERRGRLFGLAGDVLLWSGPRPTACAPPPTRSGCRSTTSNTPGPCWG
ncbi:adenylate cyclase domain protein [Mycobacterium xenopi 4042]|uniref:Adenylate cyclase domain protein n=1 Tax=Mycobacterium xenopi 4042 TaxID=1299334 RepID=X8DDJ5_MYCXE|nr:adenylate cyclase domain protein [Mycobacterium xenopi 4042]